MMEKTHIDRLVTPDYFNRKECEGCGCCISICRMKLCRCRLAPTASGGPASI